MIQLVDDGYHIVRLSGPVINLFSTQIPFIWTCYVYFNRLVPTYATRRLHDDFFNKVHFITTTRPIRIILD